MALKLAKRMSVLEESEIRKILKLTEKSDIISFAGGLPAPELFPVDELIDISKYVLETMGSKALQYSTTEGYLPLREWIANRMNTKLSTSFDADNILITHGSQQAIDLCGKVLLDENDIVVCESPTYLAALSAFKAYGCKFIEITTDDEGMDMNELQEALETHDNIKAIYVIPNFQNPTGRSWSLDRRKTLVALANKHNVAILEDNPYGELRFEGEFLPSLCKYDTNGIVLSTGTFSKIFCPGYRIGWIAGDKQLIRNFVCAKQSVDLQSNTIAQMEIAEYLKKYDIDKHIEEIRKTYRLRRNLMIATMEESFPNKVEFTRPEGGLFLWVTLPENIDAQDVLLKCIEENVAFVPGASFYPNKRRNNVFRLNFSNTEEAKIVEGIEKIGKVLHTFIH